MHSTLFHSRNQIIVTLLTFFTMASLAQAEIRLTDTAECTIELTGDIQSGDAQVFEKLIERADAIALDKNKSHSIGSKFTPILCLNSDGGSYAEAIKIIDLIFEMRTYVRAHHRCYSACALIFLTGRIDQGFKMPLTPDRWLSVSGKLGFHAPQSPVDDQSNKAYASGVRAVAALVARLGKGNTLFPPDLLAEALKVVEPHDFFHIDTVDQALHWDIRLANLPIEVEAITNCSLARACLNRRTIKDPDNQYEASENREEWLDDKVVYDRFPRVTKAWYAKKPGFTGLFHRSTIEMDMARIGRPSCLVDLHKSAKFGLIIDVQVSDSFSRDEMGPRNKLENIASLTGKVTGVSTAYLLNPKTKFADLVNVEGRAQAIRCEAIKED